MVGLGTLGGSASLARAVSNRGQIVGVSSIFFGQDIVRGFVWTNTTGMVELSPLPGYLSSIADFVSNEGHIVGSSANRDGFERLTMWVVPPPDDTGDGWTFCAPEGSVCEFSGTMEVRYGANGLFFFKTLTDGTACTNEMFGDPIYGTVKQCAIEDTPPPTEWTFCASEGGVCAFTGTTEVRYGANGAYVYQTLTDGTACANAVFGDPIVGTVKQCSIRSTPSPTEWTICATEGDVCAFTGTMEVRYGANGSFFYQTLTDGTACTNEVFGDPIYGVVKACDRRTGAGSPPQP